MTGRMQIRSLVRLTKAFSRMRENVPLPELNRASRIETGQALSHRQKFGGRSIIDTRRLVA